VSAIDTASRPLTWRGIFVALAAAAAFSFSNMSAAMANGGGATPLAVAAVRYLAPAIALVIWLRLSGGSLLLPRRDAAVAVGLGIVTAFYTWALLKSFTLIPFALAVLIFYLFPLLAAGILAALGWEKFAWRTGAGIVVAIGGLALALNVSGGHIEPQGVLLAGLAAVGLAIVVTVSSRMFGKGDARPLTLYMAASASAFLFILCAVSRDFVLPQTSPVWFGFIASTALYAFAMIAFYIAVSMIGPVLSSLLSYADAVISAALGVAVLGQALAPIQLAGMALVIVALIGATAQRSELNNSAVRRTD
jgi:drug/metabolite transporter (DMT)-like permease